MTRTLFLMMLVPLLACPPALRDDDDAVGDDDDAANDDDATSSGDLEDIYDGMTDGACDVIPDNDSMLPNGAGVATEGLWYEVRCIWTGGNASEITVELNYFDSFGGGDFEVTGFIARDVGGSTVGLEGDLGSLHVLAGQGGRLDGWWEGDLRGADAAGQEVQLSAIVFRGAPVEQVAGR